MMKENPEEQLNQRPASAATSTAAAMTSATAPSKSMSATGAGERDGAEQELRDNRDGAPQKDGRSTWSTHSQTSYRGALAWHVNLAAPIPRVFSIRAVRFSRANELQAPLRLSACGRY